MNLPAEEVPPELPEPALGINFARDGMQRKDWLSLVAVHSDAWLLAVAFYYGARFDKNDRYPRLCFLPLWLAESGLASCKQRGALAGCFCYRDELGISLLRLHSNLLCLLLRRKRLFNMVNELPTVFDIVTGKKQKEKAGSAPANKGSSKAKVRTRTQACKSVPLW